MTVHPSGDDSAEIGTSDPAAGTCPNCGLPLSPDAPAGLCAKCLLKMGFDSVPHGSVQESAYRAPFVAPLPEHLNPLFPNLIVEERIGHGGMGVVYRAQQVPLGRTVALKILRPDIENDPTFAERFQREAKLLAQLQHPNIITIFDFGRTENLFYLTMEYVEGANLRQIGQAGELDAKSALAIVPQICSALEVAHAQGIVHRDIKPENILVNTHGQVKIADFGLAKMCGQDDFSLTRQGQVMGTPHYMAPEQFERPSEVDHRADIYSLGVVLYEMLTGELPLGRFDVPSHRASIDVRLDKVVLSALEKRPEMRYQRIADVKTDIERVANAPLAPTPNPQSSNTVHGPAADWSGEWHGDNGLRLSSRILKWCAVGDAIMALVFLVAVFTSTDDYLPVFFCSAIACLVGAATYKLLQRREYLPFAVIGCALLLVPLPTMIPRVIGAGWSLCILALSRPKFTFPAFRESQVWQDVRGWFGRVPPATNAAVHRSREIANETAGWLSWVQKSVGGWTGRVIRFVRTTFSRVVEIAAKIVSLLRKLISPLRLKSILLFAVLVVVWTLCCLGMYGALLTGWADKLAPTRAYFTDGSASRLENPFGFKNFGLAGSGGRIHANPPVEQELFYSRIKIRADIQSGPELVWDPTTGLVEQSSFAWQESEELTRDVLVEWLQESGDRLGIEKINLNSGDAKQGVDDLMVLLERIRIEPVASVGKQRLIVPLESMMHRDVFKVVRNSRYNGYQIKVFDGSTDLNHAFASLLPFCCWLFGVIGLVPFGFSSVRRAAPEKSGMRRILGIGSALATATWCSGVALMVYLWQDWLHTHDSLFGVSLEQYIWFRRPETFAPMAISLLILTAIATLFLCASAKFYFSRLATLRVWPVTTLVFVLALTATTHMLLNMPWHHYWPLLVPMWLAVVAGLLLLVCDTTVETTSQQA